MRDYGRIRTAFWTDDRMSDASDAARLLAAYLLSGPHSNAVGCYRMPPGYISDDLRWEREKAEATLSELEGLGFIQRCAKSNWLLIPNYLRHNPPENPNVWKACQKALEQVPLSVPFAKALLNGIETVSKEFAEGFGKRFRNIEMEMEPEPVTSSEPNGSAPCGAVVSLDPVKSLFDSGVAVLTAGGVPEKSARSVIGQLRKAAGDEEAARVIAAAARATDPLPFVQKAIQRGPPANTDVLEETRRFYTDMAVN